MRRHYLGPERPDRIIVHPRATGGRPQPPSGGRHSGGPVADKHVDIIGRDQVAEEELKKNPGPG